MTPLPPEYVARWLPDWLAFAALAQLAARTPADGDLAARLQHTAERAAGDWKGVGAWPSPFGQTRDQYAGASLIWLAKAYGRQGSEPMRQSLALALEHLALAFLGRLERASAAIGREAPPAAPVAPVLPLRRRRLDIDGPPDDDDDDDAHTAGGG